MAQEKNFENKIKAYLKDQNCYFVKYFANRMTKAGIPDILASVNGCFVGIEVKASKQLLLAALEKERLRAVWRFGMLFHEEERIEALLTCKRNEVGIAEKEELCPSC